MPIYTYECGRCGERLEEVRAVAARLEPATCQKCGAPAEFVLSIPGKEIIRAEGGPIAERSKSQLEHELSEQVQHNELPPHLADAEAKLGGL